MKIISSFIATVMTAAVLTLGLSIPSHAEEPAAAPVSCEQYLSESQYREGLLHAQVDAMQTAARVANRDLRQAERKIDRQRATIKRLRAQLAAARS